MLVGRLLSLVPPGATIEVLARGFTWAEGPIWVPDGGYLLFSDVPENRIYQWKDTAGLKIWLEPSGYTGDVPRGGEPGSNGLRIDAQGRLVTDASGISGLMGDRTPKRECTFQG